MNKTKLLIILCLSLLTVPLFASAAYACYPKPPKPYCTNEPVYIQVIKCKQPVSGVSVQVRGVGGGWFRETYVTDANGWIVFGAQWDWGSSGRYMTERTFQIKIRCGPYRVTEYITVDASVGGDYTVYLSKVKGQKLP